MRIVPLGELITPARVSRAGSGEYPILSMTMHEGLVDQGSKFKKRVASADLSSYKVVKSGQLVVGFPIDEGVLDFQTLYLEGIVSPAYGVWDLVDENRVDRAYMKRFLRSPRAMSYYKARLRGSTARRRSLPSSVFLAMKVPLPPLEDQRRIAATLDKADSIRAKRRQVLDHLDALTQSIFHDMFREYRWDSTVGDLAEIRIGPFGSLLHKEDYIDDGVPVINPMHIMNGRVHPDLKFTVSEEKAARLARYRLKYGDVILGRRGEMGRAGTIQSDQTGMLCGTGSMIVRPHDVSAQFMCHLLSSTKMRLYLERASLGITMANLNEKIVSSAPAPRVSKSETEYFSEKIQRIREQSTMIRRGISIDNQLFASLQSRAFNGKL